MFTHESSREAMRGASSDGVVAKVSASRGA